MTIKIGVISDTHIPDRAQYLPLQIMQEFKKMDMIIHAGDLVELNVLEKLRAICPDVKAVWGNMDPLNVRNKLPGKLIFKAGNHNIGVMHGYGAPNKLTDFLASVFKDDDVSVIIFGHTHYSVNEKRGNILFFNPGSLTDKLFSTYNSYGIIEINDRIEARIVKL